MASMRTAVVAGLLIWGAAAGAWAQTAEPMTTAAIVDYVKKGVVRVMGVSIDSPVAANWGGGGSGFVFEVDYANGVAYALTNHHVSGSSSVSQVQFWDNSTYRAELVATEPGIDVALLRINGIPDERYLPEEERTVVPVTLGDSDQVRIGEYGLAFGNPGSMEAVNTNRSDPWEDFLMKQTVTTNVVAGRDTPLEFMVGIWQQNQSDLGFQYGTNLDYAFRISVPINAGNSGGPLFNQHGEAIGINFYGGQHMMMQNHNWAVPINLAKDFAFQVLETGRFEKPWLGLDIIMPSFIRGPGEYMEFAEKYRGDEIKVFGVRAGSPAERAGLLEGDIILEIDKRAFASPEDIRLYVFDQDIGAMMEFLVRRNGREERIFCEVGPKRGYDAEFSV
jgi:S1-C subfamily serine protease